jgi:hypothetical protein
VDDRLVATVERFDGRGVPLASISALLLLLLLLVRLVLRPGLLKFGPILDTEADPTVLATVVAVPSLCTDLLLVASGWSGTLVSPCSFLRCAASALLDLRRGGSAGGMTVFGGSRLVLRLMGTGEGLNMGDAGGSGTADC